MRPSLLTQFAQHTKKVGLNLHGVQVIQAGPTMDQYQWIAEEPRMLRSLSKSFASYAVGIAIGEGAVVA